MNTNVIKNPPVYDQYGNPASSTSTGPFVPLVGGQGYGSLPMTGLEISFLIAAALLIICAGCFMRKVGRRG